jgi:hypothetical protein
VSSGTLSNCALVGNVAYRGGGAHESTLSNCALTGNSAVQAGGGAFGGTLNKCDLSGNLASGGGGASWSALNNCTLALNLAHDSGGGVSGGTLNNCTLTVNSASLYGGGVAESTLTNCALIANSSDYWGGGAHDSTLNNCTLTGNSAKEYGGVYWCNLYNCIVYFNTAMQDANFDYNNTLLTFCCTTPAPLYGVGSITNEPIFANPAAADFRLQTNSPCINSGNNAYAANSSGDLDGHPRIVRRTVDIGAYEYQGGGSAISYAWLQQYGLPTDGSVDHAHSDLDGQDNWHEWRADTNPTNATSCFRLTIVSNTPPVAVTLSSSAARLYTLLSCTNLTPSAVWTPVPGQSEMPGSGGVLTFSDSNPPAPAFYRVSVRFP